MANPSCDAILAPAEYQALRARNLSETTCVVFDILRATSSMIVALANGARAIAPVSEIEEALQARAMHPDWLLAGERHGLRIGRELTGGIEFDFGNSPREFTREKVEGRSIAMTTTNGTRALRACAGARRIWVGSLLNLSATAREISKALPGKLLLVCAGTAEEAALEDTLAAGALFCALEREFPAWERSDAVHLAALAFRSYQQDLQKAIPHARNGRRLLTIPDLQEDIPVCLSMDRFDFTASCGTDGKVVVTNQAGLTTGTEK